MKEVFVGSILSERFYRCRCIHGPAGSGLLFSLSCKREKSNYMFHNTLSPFSLLYFLFVRRIRPIYRLMNNWNSTIDIIIIIWLKYICRDAFGFFRKGEKENSNCRCYCCSVCYCYDTYHHYLHLSKREEAKR